MATCPNSFGRTRSHAVGRDLAGLGELIAAHKQGSLTGVYAVCSAHPSVLAAVARQAAHDGSLLLVESTSNQVNQGGGYAGMGPAQFSTWVQAIAGSGGLSAGKLLVGGDHLGPYPWRQEPAARAMDRARALVHDCVRAGYGKLHLDASVRCGDDPQDRPLTPPAVAGRVAELCAAAEDAFRTSGMSQPPCYVVGTDVPPPGGAQRSAAGLAVTRVEEAQETLELTQAAFRERRLEGAWERVVAVVVHPGVEFGDDTVIEYNRSKAAQLSQFIAEDDRLVFEVHSTDYQPRDALRALVEDHFAILKVGPALTFAFREAAFALALIEAEWLAGREGMTLSNLRQVLDAAMLARPEHWQAYHEGTPAHVRYARAYSFSDRARYYWHIPAVQEALARLLANLEQRPIPVALLSQFLPEQCRRVKEGSLANRPPDLIDDKIRSVLADYVIACGCGRQDPGSR